MVKKWDSDNVDHLKDIILRLTNENARWRRKFEETEILLRRRAPSASGLTMKGAVKIILDERDDCAGRVDFFREEMKRVLQLLLEDKEDEARKELNMFLFNNPR